MQNKIQKVEVISPINNCSGKKDLTMKQPDNLIE